jgi:hypothetical protein
MAEPSDRSKSESQFSAESGSSLHGNLTDSPLNGRSDDQRENAMNSATINGTSGRSVGSSSIRWIWWLGAACVGVAVWVAIFLAFDII